MQSRSALPMPASHPRTAWTPRRRRGAAIQLIVAGVLLMGVPAVLGDSVIAAACRALSPFAWLMAVAGAVLLLFLRDDRAACTAGLACGQPLSAAVPLQLEPVQPTSHEAHPLRRSAADPPRPREDTEASIDPSRH